MRTDIPAALQAHLNTRQTTTCWCWKITRRDNVVLGFTNHDRDLTFDSVTYEASTGFLGTEIESQLGMSVDNMDVMGAIDSNRITETDIEAGRYDNADIDIFLVNWQDVSQRVIMKRGNVGNVKRGRTMFEAEVRGISHEMQQVQGRLYSYKCDATLGDTRCKVNLASSTFTGTGAVISSASSSSVVASGLDVYENGWFSKGTMTFTSGNNNGLTREVRSHSNINNIVTISLWEGFPFAITAADAFTIAAGCDKLFRTCKAKFNNETNFRGFPHVPGPNTITSYANIGDPNMDGGGNFLGKD